jgi:hypothetical protein
MKGKREILPGDLGVKGKLVPRIGVGWKWYRVVCNPVLLN